MAKRDTKKSFQENIGEIETLLQKHIPDGIKSQALFIHEINKTIDKDNCGRVQFHQYAVAMRRKYVEKSFNGKNLREIAELFDTTDDVIEKDITLFYKSKSAKKMKGLESVFRQKKATV